MELFFRKGKKEDAKLVAPFIVAAMGDLAYTFIGQKDELQACALFERFVALEDNQYSYQNLYVAELENYVVGIVLAYDGGVLDTLRKPFLDYLEENYAVNFENIQDETASGEYYLDCISIDTKYQGHGIAGRLLRYTKEEIKQFSNLPLGLIVEKNNLTAQKAYLKAGFQIVGYKIFMLHDYWHMQLK